MINAIRFLFAALVHPKRLVLDGAQAAYVSALFQSGSSPEDVGRAMDKTYGRKSWKYFQIPNAVGNGFEFSESVDYYIDGLEYLRSAMITLGAIVVKRDGDYYVAEHPLTKWLAAKVTTAPIPEAKRRA